MEPSWGVVSQGRACTSGHAKRNRWRKPFSLRSWSARESRMPGWMVPATPIDGVSIFIGSDPLRSVWIA